MTERELIERFKNPAFQVQLNVILMAHLILGLYMITCPFLVGAAIHLLAPWFAWPACFVIVISAYRSYATWQALGAVIEAYRKFKRTGKVFS